MNDPVTQIIVWLSPFLGASFLWFLNNHITAVKDQITEVKGRIGTVSNEINELKISVAKIQLDVEHIKNTDKIDEKKVTDIFENNIVTVIKRAKKRFE